MPDRIDHDLLISMMSEVVRRLRAARDELAALDAATGDGDHGAAMGKVADAIEQCLQRDDEAPGIPALMSRIGWAIMEIDAGSTGPLYGSFFQGMGEYASKEDSGFDTSAWAAMFRKGLANLQNFTAALPGDKTMIDALQPAVDALHEVATANRSAREALTAAAAAAEAGAAQTATMKASFGRARNIGERSIGHIDPGAASMAIIFAGLKEGFSRG